LKIINKHIFKFDFLEVNIYTIGIVYIIKRWLRIVQLRLQAKVEDTNTIRPLSNDNPSSKSNVAPAFKDSIYSGVLQVAPTS